MKQKFFILAAICCAAICIPTLASAQQGRGQSAPPNSENAQPVTRFAYAVDGLLSNGSIDEFTFDTATNRLKNNGWVAADSPAMRMSLVDPSNRFLYIADMGEGTYRGGNGAVSGYTIDPTTGVLTDMPGSPFEINLGFVNSIAVHPNGQFLYASNAGGTVSGFRIDQSSGALIPLPFPPALAGSYTDGLTMDPLGRFLYASNEGLVGGPNVSAYTINAASGGLTPIPGSPFLGSIEPDIPAINPAGTFLYVPGYVTGQDELYVYSINPVNGELSEISGSPFSLTTYTLESLFFTPNGTFMYATGNFNTFYPSICGFGLHAITGVPTELGCVTPPYEAQYQSGGVVDFAGRNLFLPGQGVLTYSINQKTGALTPTSGVGTRAGGGSPALAGGKQPVKYVPTFAYVANSGSNNISTYSIDPKTGALTAGVPAPSGAKPVSVTVDPTGQYAYSANSGSNNVSGFSIGQSTGALSPVIGSPFTAGEAPSSVAADVNGNVSVANSGSNNMVRYVIGSGGTLVTPTRRKTSLNPSSLAASPAGNALYVATTYRSVIDLFPFVTSTIDDLEKASWVLLSPGDSPVSIAVDPEDRYLITANHHSNSISVMSGQNAEFGKRKAYAVGTAPSGVAIDPTGRFVYVANSGSNDVTAFTLDIRTGVLKPVPGSPFPAGTNPSSVGTDISGNFVYVTNAGSGNVSGFSIDQKTGALTPLAGSPFLAGENPASIALTGKIQ
jgi:6-phosphogluconolactonase